MGPLRFWTNGTNNPRGEEPYAQAGRTGGLVTENANVLPDDHIFKFLLDNAGAGDSNLVGDFSGGNATDARITAPAGYEYVLFRMLVKIQDGNSGFNASTYGAVGQLTNGILVRVHDDSGTVRLDLTDGVPIVGNVEWARYAFDATAETFGNGDNFFKVRWTFSNSGSPVVLRPGWSLRALLRDNLSGLSGHRMMVQGYRRAL